MKKALALIAVAGLATVASAQEFMTLSFTADKASATVGESITWTVSAAFTSADYLFNVNANFVASADLGTASQFSWASWAGTPAVGTVSGASLNNVGGGQSLLFGAVDASNPIVLGTFTVVTTAEGTLSYTGTQGTLGGAMLTSQVTTSAFGDFDDYNPGANGLSIESASVNIVPVPAPGALALVGLGGLAAARRRR